MGEVTAKAGNIRRPLLDELKKLQGLSDGMRVLSMFVENAGSYRLRLLHESSERKDGLGVCD